MGSWDLSGDVFAAILSSSNPIPGSPAYSEKLREQHIQKKLINHINRQSNFWTARDLEKEVLQTRGQAVFIDSELNGAICAADLNLHSEAFKKLYANFQDKLETVLGDSRRESEVRNKISLLNAELMLFISGEASMALFLSMPSGWGNGSFEKLFGPENRNTIAKEITWLLTEMHNDLQSHITRFVSDTGGLAVRALSGKTLKPEIPIKPINSLNLIFAGAPSETISHVLPERYRKYVYPSGPSEVQSQTPNRDEFVFFGYAFGLIAAANPYDRLKDISLVPRLIHVLFNNLTEVSNEVRALRSTTFQPMKIKTTSSYFRRLQSDIRMILSPTMMFRHEMLLLRDAIIKEWFVDRSIDEAETLLRGLVNDERRRHEQRQRRRDWILNIVLAVLTVVSMVSVASDMAERGWWPFN